jgi:hypothetical protein
MQQPVPQGEPLAASAQLWQQHPSPQFPLSRQLLP